jgi:hypothetical protein
MHIIFPRPEKKPSHVPTANIPCHLIQQFDHNPFMLLLFSRRTVRKLQDAKVFATDIFQIRHNKAENPIGFEHPENLAQHGFPLLPREMLQHMTAVRHIEGCV